MESLLSYTHALSTMLSNLRKRFIDSQQEQQPLLSWAETDSSDYPDQANDAVAQPHRAVAVTEPVYVTGCTCLSCSRHSERNHDADATGSRSLPSTRSIVQVLYPPSYLGTTPSFPDPPSYSPTYPDRGDNTETFSLISTTTSVEGAPLSLSHSDPLAQDPSLTGVPSQETPSSGIPPVEPNPPIITLGGAVSEEIEPLPGYSRFDQRRSRFPTASDVLGPYPPLPVLRPAVS